MKRTELRHKGSRTHFDGLTKKQIAEGLPQGFYPLAGNTREWQDRGHRGALATHAPVARRGANKIPIGTPRA
jgi:hypothetical protein